MMRKMSALAVGLRVGSLFVLLPLGGCFTYADAPLEAASQARRRGSVSTRTAPAAWSTRPQ